VSVKVAAVTDTGENVAAVAVAVVETWKYGLKTTRTTTLIVDGGAVDPSGWHLKRLTPFLR
jgi:hypothetical protein